jgi:hypothetical protein
LTRAPGRKEGFHCGEISAAAERLANRLEHGRGVTRLRANQGIPD